MFCFGHGRGGNSKSQKGVCTWKRCSERDGECYDVSAYTDYCDVNGNLVEYYAWGSDCRSVTISCPSGYVWSDGACIQQVTITGCKSEWDCSAIETMVEIFTKKVHALGDIVTFQLNNVKHHLRALISA